jgi:hypothetical protein
MQAIWRSQSQHRPPCRTNDTRHRALTAHGHIPILTATTALGWATEKSIRFLVTRHQFWGVGPAAPSLFWRLPSLVVSRDDDYTLGRDLQSAVIRHGLFHIGTVLPRWQFRRRKGDGKFSTPTSTISGVFARKKVWLLLIRIRGGGWANRQGSGMSLRRTLIKMLICMSRRVVKSTPRSKSICRLRKRIRRSWAGWTP